MKNKTTKEIAMDQLSDARKWVSSKSGNLKRLNDEMNTRLDKKIFYQNMGKWLTSKIEHFRQPSMGSGKLILECVAKLKNEDLKKKK